MYCYSITEVVMDKQKNAERQRRYRQRALKDPEGPRMVRLQVMLSVEAADSLERICEKTGKTKKEVVELALVELEKNWCCIPD